MRWYIVSYFFYVGIFASERPRGLVAEPLLALQGADVAEEPTIVTVLFYPTWEKEDFPPYIRISPDGIQPVYRVKKEFVPLLVAARIAEAVNKVMCFVWEEAGWEREVYFHRASSPFTDFAQEVIAACPPPEDGSGLCKDVLADAVAKCVGGEGLAYFMKTSLYEDMKHYLRAQQLTFEECTHYGNLPTTAMRGELIDRAYGKFNLEEMSQLQREQGEGLLAIAYRGCLLR